MGSPAGDPIVGGGSGKDQIFGQAGDDVLSGGTEADRIAGGGGKNRDETAALGNDTLNGNDDNDLLIGQGGNDVLEGAGGVDRVHGGSGADDVHGGGALNNILVGSGQTDFCSLGPIDPAKIDEPSDQGDVRDQTCENPRQGDSEWVTKSGSKYSFTAYNITGSLFNWDTFTGQNPPPP